MLAFVTGGNRGIGLAVCEGLAKKGIKVLLGSRHKSDGIKEAKKLQEKGLDVTPVVIDLSDKQSIHDAVAEITKNYGVLDILVNNAAVFPEGNLVEITEQQLEEGIDVNLMGPIHLIRMILPSMVRKNYGRIVNVSSGSGSFNEGLEGPAIYCVSKAALNALTVTVARQLPNNVKINSVCPGWVRTRMGGEEAPRSVEEGADTILWLATLPEKGPSGLFFRDRTQIQW